MDKLLEAQPQVPTLTHIYFDEPRGLRNYQTVMSYERLQRSAASRSRQSRLLRRRDRQRQERRRRDHAVHIGDDRSRRACARRTRR